MAIIYTDKDATLDLVRGKKVAVIGYGSQGHAHSLNLKDSGVDVRVGLREGSGSGAKAREAGLNLTTMTDAAAQADVIMMLVPDTEHAATFTEHVLPNLSDGKTLLVSHGFSVRFGQVKAPAGVNVAMIAPKGPGHL